MIVGTFGIYFEQRTLGNLCLEGVIWQGIDGAMKHLNTLETLQK